jgi:hypothetical protein
MTETETPLPIDWDDWRRELHDWLAAHPELHAVSKRGTPFYDIDRNLMADDVIGLFRLPSGRLVELSEVTFPDLTRPSRSADRRRYIGVTFDGPGAAASGDLSDSWTHLERQLGLAADGPESGVSR